MLVRTWLLLLRLWRSFKLYVSSTSLDIGYIKILQPSYYVVSLAVYIDEERTTASWTLSRSSASLTMTRNS